MAEKLMRVNQKSIGWVREGKKEKADEQQSREKKGRKLTKFWVMIMLSKTIASRIIPIDRSCSIVDLLEIKI